MGERPLKMQWFHILLALSGGSLHGSAIQRAVFERTDGALQIWPATLVRSLRLLAAAGLIQRASGPDDEAPDLRRQYYCLTERGRRRLAIEAELLGRWATAAARATGGSDTEASG